MTLRHAPAGRASHNALVLALVFIPRLVRVRSLRASVSLLILVVVLAGLAAVACSSDEPELDACTAGANDLYERRVEPVLLSDQPSSCNQCHLSGVDLSLFVRKTPCETMACMIDAGLVDLERPASSVVLGWIERASPESELITEAVIEAEYAAFHEWISYVADCGACSKARCSSGQEAGFCELDVDPAEAYDGAGDSGGCDDKSLEKVFLETVYSTRGRCYPCHFTSTQSPPPGATSWLVEGENCEASSLATLRNVLSNGYVNEDEPEQSLLLLKPLSISDGGVVHGGHDKFTAGEPAYDNFVYWLTRYGNCAKPPAED